MMKNVKTKKDTAVLSATETLLTEREFRFAAVLILGAFFFVGLFHVYLAMLWGILGCAFLLSTVVRRNQLRIFNNTNGWCLCGICGCYLLTVIWGIDRGMSVIGFLRSLVWLVFGVLLMQLSSEQRQRLKKLIPYTISAVVLLGLPAYFIPFLYDSFFTYERLGSFLQYPNTLGILCLISAVMLLEREQKKWYHALLGGLLLGGMLLSGSRVVFGLFGLTVLYYLIRQKTLRKILLIALGAGIVCVGGYLLITKDFTVVGRFLTVFSDNRTLLARFLYAQDALPILLRHPLGLGYYGYADIQGSYATGVYNVLFAHNDILQTALDAGIPALLLLLTALARSVVSKRCSRTDKLVIALLAAHSVFDFDLQYPAVVFVLLLNMDLYHGEPLALKKPERRFLTAVTACFGTVFLYFGIALGLARAGLYSASLKLYPYHTETVRTVMSTTTDSDVAERLALFVTGQNAYADDAFAVLGTVAYGKGEYEQAIAYYIRAAKCAPYNRDHYNQAMIIASAGISVANDSRDYETMRALMEQIAQLEEMRQATLANTSALGEKQEHLPNLTLSPNTEAYIKSVTEALRDA